MADINNNNNDGHDDQSESLVFKDSTLYDNGSVREKFPHLQELWNNPHHHYLDDEFYRNWQPSHVDDLEDKDDHALFFNILIASKRRRSSTTAPKLSPSISKSICAAANCAAVWQAWPNSVPNAPPNEMETSPPATRILSIISAINVSSVTKRLRRPFHAGIQS
ncbi:hypothetical protein DERF_010317 [Dermatophagoides farinae]|uniref:Uncharacterized protein n=1 Tax=Dermatophagoides farinae TaxID=6954 RepID=A0A922HY58_DERFA|nr:hypothetical protein DERF_010317 [Dermatophagoides farinae]